MSPRDVLEMELPDVNALLEYWGTTPPVHVSVAAYLGLGEKKHMTAEEFAAAVGAKRKEPKSG